MSVILDSFLDFWSKRKVVKRHVGSRVHCYINKLKGDKAFAGSLKVELEFHKDKYEQVIFNNPCSSGRCLVKNELKKIVNGIKTYKQYKRILGEKLRIWKEAFPLDPVPAIDSPPNGLPQVLKDSLVSWEIDIVEDEAQSSLHTDDHMKKIRSDMDSAISIMAEMHRHFPLNERTEFLMCVVVGVYQLEVKYLDRILQIWKTEF
ncbi:hypothetical protein BGX34_000811 [Mortierella sp. NVP85]|nr:hypothetical protein BGX34_000811 [Mortierella sp. NVP85]